MSKQILLFLIFISFFYIHNSDNFVLGSSFLPTKRMSLMADSLAQVSFYRKLFSYIQSDNLKEIKKIIIDGINLNGISFATTPLIFACNLERVKVVKLLLKSGADPDLKDYLGETPLTKASKKRNIKLIKLLLKFHADIYLKDSSDLNPIEIIMNKGFDLTKNEVSILNLFLKYKSENKKD